MESQHQPQQLGDREGTLPAKRGKCYQRYYTDEDIAIALNLESIKKGKNSGLLPCLDKKCKKRISEHQRQALETYTINARIAVDDWIKDAR